MAEVISKAVREYVNKVCSELFLPKWGKIRSTDQLRYLSRRSSLLCRCSHLKNRLTKLKYRTVLIHFKGGGNKANVTKQM